MKGRSMLSEIGLTYSTLPILKR